MLDPKNILKPSDEYINREGEIRAFGNEAPDGSWARLPTPESTRAQMGMAIYLARMEGHNIEEDSTLLGFAFAVRDDDGKMWEINLRLDENDQWEVMGSVKPMREIADGEWVVDEEEEG